ncbi:chromatin assembly factor 1 subunit FAS1 isoform X1 [Musa acuminata AAA Group]|uniref:chromatin assembly factor 1 subunit FAS1 isoform X1 n=1 Tax=Musa acuminata AAA Group TaxID=214697 RepID=UPI0031E2CA93
MTTGCTGGVIPGADRTDECNPPKVDEDAMILEKIPVKEEESVVVNKAPEFDGEFMDPEDTPDEEAKRNQTKADHDEKGVHCTNTMSLDIPAQGSKHVLGMAKDNSHVKKRRNCHTEVKDEQRGAGKQLKRKRVATDGNMNSDDKEFLTAECRREIEELFEYYKEFSGLGLQHDDSECHSNNLMIAYLLEERSLSFSKLVEEIYDKLKGREGITLASVCSTVLFVGQRVMYGISSADADVLEDESESCLWCWETRDIKLFSADLRAIVNIRRIARKKIHERISALCATLSVLTSSEYKDGQRTDLMKPSMILGKILNKQGISSLVEKLTQKKCVDNAAKEARLQEKELMKEAEKNKRSAEKEKKKMDLELQKEKLRIEKERKRMQEEAERQEKRREKEEAELKKQNKKRQEEAAREQRRREKEEAEQKKQLAMQKQASMMECFLRSKKSSNSSDNSDRLSPMKSQSVDTASKNEGITNAVTSSMDCAFSQQYSVSMEDLCRLHIAGWHKLAHCNRSCHWGQRRNPKMELIKELKLQRPYLLGESPDKMATPMKDASSYEVNSSSESSYYKFDDELESSISNTSHQNDPIVASSSARSWIKKLLQFDKSFKPAYYGTWHRKSGFVGPRHPFRKDPELDYDVDSDEEWEEEDPGESLSDCEKDVEEILDAENLKDEDDIESEDSFVVPDGYLSENEGLQIETSEFPDDEAKVSECCKLEVDNEEFRTLLQQHKILCTFTERALRKSQPLVISNLSHEKIKLLSAEDLNGKAKAEQVCLQALCMRAIPGGAIVDIFTNPSTSYEDQQVPLAPEESAAQAATAPVVSDKDLPEYVRLIQSCPHGINKLVDVLLHKFPSIPKSQLRNKIREISDFVDNRWQVKKDVLQRLGLSASEPSPDKGGKQKSIAMYFSKRCLPPEGQSINISESSPQSSTKSKAQNFVSDGQFRESGLQFRDL